MDRLRDAVHAVGSQVSRLDSGAAMLRRRADQIAALRGDARELAVRIVRLERVLDFERVAGHVRGEVAQATLAAGPIPHLRVSNLLPHDAYTALVEMLPAPVFFEGSVEQGYDLRVPLRLAPASSMVAYRFLNDVGRLVTDLVLVRLADGLMAFTRRRFPSLPPPGAWDAALALTDARLVRRTPGYTGRVAADHTWDLVTGVLDLAREPDGPEYGGRLQDLAIPFRANTLLAWAGPPEAHTYAAIPAGAAADTARHSYELNIGPARSARRRLTALMRSAT